MVSKRRPKHPTTKPKTEPPTKLKTMNEISAAEAVKLFEASMNFPGGEHWGDPEEDYLPITKGFPLDVAARDFLDCLKLYREWYMDSESYGPVWSPEVFEEQKAGLIKVVTEHPEILVQLTAKERAVIVALDENNELTREEVADKLGMKLGTLKKHMENAGLRLNQGKPLSSRAGIINKFKALPPG